MLMENGNQNFFFFLQCFLSYQRKFSLFRPPLFCLLQMHSIWVSQPFPKQALVFSCLLYKSLENTVGKGEIARNEQHCFLTFWTTFSHVYQISNCRLQTLSIWMSKNFVVWERVYKRRSMKLYFRIQCKYHKLV